MVQLMSDQGRHADPHLCAVLSPRGPIDVKFGHQTLTPKPAFNFAAKVVGDHLQSGLGRGQARTIFNTLTLLYAEPYHIGKK